MKKSLTLLQRAVIRRLRERGFDQLAELAKESWSAGEALVLPDQSISVAKAQDRELAADLHQANEQAAHER